MCNVCLQTGAAPTKCWAYTDMYSERRRRLDGDVVKLIFTLEEKEEHYYQAISDCTCKQNASAINTNCHIRENRQLKISASRENTENL